MFTRAFNLSGKRRLVAVGLSLLGLTAVAAILAVTFLAFNTHPAFGSGSGGGGGCYSTSGPVCTFKGNQAYVDFSSVSADGCIFTDTYVSTYENLQNPGHVASQAVYVSMSQWDNCNEQLLWGVDNFDPNSYMPTFTGTVQYGSQLSSATINGTAPLYDYFTGAQVFTTTINVTLKGYGPTSTSMNVSQYRSPGFVMSTHFTGSSRAAEASGVITDQSGNNLATPATLNANLNNDSGGTVQLFHI
jgi:uncharacterized protein YodC (DUF2158 family)